MSKGYLASQAYNTALFRFLPFPLHLYSECNSKPPSSGFSHRLCLCFFLLCENDFEKLVLFRNLVKNKFKKIVKNIFLIYF
jgi:hypothetical protein